MDNGKIFELIIKNTVIVELGESFISYYILFNVIISLSLHTRRLCNRRSCIFKYSYGGENHLQNDA